MKVFKRLMSFLLIIQLSIVLVSCTHNLEKSVVDSLDNKTTPNLPTNASSLDGFIPPDWEGLEQGEFDFNNDGYLDYVVVINNQYEKEYEGDMGYEGKIYPRTLFVIFSNGENNYDLIYQNSDIVGVDLHGLTCCGYHTVKLECSENAFILTNFSGNNATSSYNTAIYHFTYNSDEWQISKRVTKSHRTAFIYDDDAEVDDGKPVIDINIPGIVEVESDYENNIIRHRDRLTKDAMIDDVKDINYFVFEYEFSADIATGFLNNFENENYKYYTYTNTNEVIPNVSIKRLNKTNNNEETVFEYFMNENDNEGYEFLFKQDSLKPPGFVFLEDDKIIVRIEDGYAYKRKIYRVNLVNFEAEYIGGAYPYWL